MKHLTNPLQRASSHAQMNAAGCGTVEVNPPQHSIKQREKCGLAGTLIIGGEAQWDHYGRCRLNVCARQRDPGYAVLSASVAVGRPCAPSQARTMPASYASLGHDELLP